MFRQFECRSSAFWRRRSEFHSTFVNRFNRTNVHNLPIFLSMSRKTSRFLFRSNEKNINNSFLFASAVGRMQNNVVVQLIKLKIIIYKTEISVIIGLFNGCRDSFIYLQSEKATAMCVFSSGIFTRRRETTWMWNMSRSSRREKHNNKLFNNKYDSVTCVFAARALCVRRFADTRRVPFHTRKTLQSVCHVSWS